MRIHVNPLALVGGVGVTAITKAVSSAGNLDGTVVAGCFGLTAVVLGQFLQWWFSSRQKTLLDRYQVELDKKDERIENLEAELDGRRRTREG